MTVDHHRELDQILRDIELDISRRAYNACRKIDSMFAVGTGVCDCGDDIDEHGWQNHGPVEVMIDRSWAYWVH